VSHRAPTLIARLGRATDSRAALAHSRSSGPIATPNRGCEMSAPNDSVTLKRRSTAWVSEPVEGIRWVAKCLEPSRQSARPTRIGAPVAQAITPDRSRPCKSTVRSNRRRRKSSRNLEMELSPLGESFIRERSKGITSSRSGLPSSKPRRLRLTIQAMCASGQSVRRLESTGSECTTSPSELGLIRQTRPGRSPRSSARCVERFWHFLAPSPLVGEGWGEGARSSLCSRDASEERPVSESLGAPGSARRSWLISGTPFPRETRRGILVQFRREGNRDRSTGGPIPP
jgi:hypothetical protein